MAEVWPAFLFPVSQAWMKSGASATGGRTLTGHQQVVRSDVGFWRCRMTLEVTNVGRRGEERTLAYRMLYAQLDGMAGEIEVPCTSLWRPYDINGRMLRAAGAQGVGKRGLFNHAGWGLTEPELMTVRDAASKGAMRLTIEHSQVQGLRPGHYFGIGTRLYLVSRCWQLDYERAQITGGTVTFGGQTVTFGGSALTFGGVTVLRTGENVEVIEFWPRLREAAPAGTPLILNRPVCLMNLSSDDTGVLEESVEGAARPVLEFEEAV